jgi:hypothetical protein
MDIEKINRQISRRNAIFKKATKAEKRVLIAKDVLNQIKNKKYIPKTGLWVSRIFSNLKELKGYDSIQPSLMAPSLECNCCALGAMMVSCIRYRGQTTKRDVLQGAFQGDTLLAGCGNSSGLQDLFSRTQMTEIEACFEGRGYHGLRFYKLFNEDEDRLVAICKNIIKNKGKFIPFKE